MLHHRLRGSCRGSADAPAIVASTLETRWSKFVRELARCRRRYSEGAVHDLRVATRRLVSALEIAAAVVPGWNCRKVRRLLKKRIDVFDPLRDTHVQILTVEKLISAGAPLTPYHTMLRARERALTRDVAAKIHRMKTDDLQRRVEEVREQILGMVPDTSVRHAVRDAAIGAAARAFVRVVDRYAGINAADTNTIHRLRLAFKKFRYMVEILQPLLPLAGKRMLKSMHDYQTRMGDIQDAEVLMTSVGAFASQRPHLSRSLMPVQQELSRRRAALIDTFIEACGEVFTFWPLDRLQESPKRVRSTTRRTSARRKARRT